MSGSQADGQPHPSGTAVSALSRAQRLYVSLRRGKSTLFGVGIAVGVILIFVGLYWSSNVAGRCGSLALATQLSGSQARLDWILAQCYSPHPLLRTVHTDQIFGSDVLVIAGY
jgi:hypothetical protein